MSTLLENDFNFEEISGKELLELLGECEKYLDNIDEFAQEVSSSLTEFELKNIYLLNKINNKHKDVEQLIDQSTEIIERHEQRLYMYEKSLVNIRSNFEELEMFSVWEQKQNNQLALFKDLSNIIRILDIDRQEMDSFFNLNSQTLPPHMMDFCYKLVEVSNRNLPPGVIKILAIETQLKSVDAIISEFCLRFSCFIDNLIIKNIKSANMSPKPNSHSEIHQIVNVYKPVVAIVKTLNPINFSEIYSNYSRLFEEFYNKEWQIYFDNLTKKIPVNDTGRYSKQDHSDLYRDVDEFKSRDKKVADMISEIFLHVELVTGELAEFCDAFFSLTGSSSRVNKDATPDSSHSVKKRGGGDVKLRAIVKNIFHFLHSLTKDFFDKCSYQDNYHLITIMCMILSEIAKPQQNDFFDHFLNRLPDVCNEKFEIFSAKVNITIDNKKSKKSVSEMVTFYKEFLVTCKSIVPKQFENAPPILNLYRKVLTKLMDTIDNSFVDVTEKTSREIYMIACLADAHIVALSDDRQNIKFQYTKEINQFVQTSMAVPFGKLLTFLDEIDKKLAASVSDSNIQAFVYNNKNDYKKYTKDFNLKIVKKGIEKMHKATKKQFNDLTLFTTVWNLMAKQILDEIKKIESYVQKYCVRVPEMVLEVQAKDIENWIPTLD